MRGSWKWFNRSRRPVIILSLLAVVGSVLKLLYEFNSAAAVQHSHNGLFTRKQRLKTSTVVVSSGPASDLPEYRPCSGRPCSNLQHLSRNEWVSEVNGSASIPRMPGQRFSAAHVSELGVASASSVVSSWPPRTSKIDWDPFLVVVVCSKPENTQLRLAVRRTWGLNLDSAKVLVRFFVGQDDGWDSIIAREQELHNDVIKTDLADTYFNLSRKVLSALSWSVRNAPRARYVMKTDDDTYVNVPYLLHALRSHALGDDYSITGAVCVNSSVVRDPADKWFVTYLDYPSDVYPTYVFGGGYVMSVTAARAILLASRNSDYLHLEDVYVTGILAKRAGIRRVAYEGFSFWMSKRPSPCEMAINSRVTAVNLTANEFYKLYSEIHLILRTGNWTACYQERGHD